MTNDPAQERIDEYLDDVTDWMALVDGDTSAVDMSPGGWLRWWTGLQAERNSRAGVIVTDEQAAAIMAAMGW